MVIRHPFLRASLEVLRSDYRIVGTSPEKKSLLIYGSN